MTSPPIARPTVAPSSDRADSDIIAKTSNWTTRFCIVSLPVLPICHTRHGEEKTSEEKWTGNVRLTVAVYQHIIIFRVYDINEINPNTAVVQGCFHSINRITA